MVIIVKIVFFLSSLYLFGRAIRQNVHVNKFLTIVEDGYSNVNSKIKHASVQGILRIIGRYISWVMGPSLVLILILAKMGIRDQPINYFLLTTLCISSIFAVVIQQYFSSERSKTYTEKVRILLILFMIPWIILIFHNLFNFEFINQVFIQHDIYELLAFSGQFTKYFFTLILSIAILLVYGLFLLFDKALYFIVIIFLIILIKIPILMAHFIDKLAPKKNMQGLMIFIWCFSFILNELLNCK